MKEINTDADYEAAIRTMAKEDPATIVWAGEEFKSLPTLVTPYDKVPLGDNWEMLDAPYGVIETYGAEMGNEYTAIMLRRAWEDIGIIPVYSAFDWLKANVTDEPFVDRKFVSNFWMENLAETFGAGLDYKTFCESLEGVLKDEGYDCDY